VLVALSSIPKEVRLPLAVRFPVILIFPVPVISFEFRSRFPVRSTVPESFNKIVLLAGKVTNTSLVPALKLTNASLLELEITVSLDNVPAPTVPIPTSKSPL
jgi:hypothetical protein